MEGKSPTKALVIIAIIGTLGTIIVAVINKCNTSPEPKEIKSTQVTTEKQPSNVEPTGTNLSNDTTIKVDPSKLADIIREEQNKAVRISYSETDCFRETDFENFKKERKAEQIVNDLVKDNSFITIVIAIKKIPPVERQRLLKSYSGIAKSTWAELGRITPEGQTNAGKKAELMVSNGIIKKVEELIKLSIPQLEKLYR